MATFLTCVLGLAVVISAGLLIGISMAAKDYKKRGRL